MIWHSEWQLARGADLGEVGIEHTGEKNLLRVRPGRHKIDLGVADAVGQGKLFGRWKFPVPGIEPGVMPTEFVGYKRATFCGRGAGAANRALGTSVARGGKALLFGKCNSGCAPKGREASK